MPSSSSTSRQEVLPFKIRQAVSSHNLNQRVWAVQLATWTHPRWIPLDETSPTAPFFRRLQEELPRLRLPALLVWGREDDVFPLSNAERFRALLPGAGAPVLVTGRHFLQEDSPEEITGAIAAFLRDLPPASDGDGSEEPRP